MFCFILATAYHGYRVWGDDSSRIQQSEVGDVGESKDTRDKSYRYPVGERKVSGLRKKLI